VRFGSGIVAATVFVTVVGATLAAASTEAAADCSQADRNAGECRSIDAETGGDEVVVRVDTSTPGSPGSPGGPASGGSPSDTVAQAPALTPPPGRTVPQPPRNPVLGSDDCQITIGGRCRASSPPKITPTTPAPPTPSAPAPPTPPSPPRSASELGSFRPENPGLRVEPGSWSMPRLPTNFVARAHTHTRSGELAGWPVEVRFTPHRYHWSFGDGHRVSWSQPGKTWSAWGRQQFDPTPTSHVYRTPGTYTASLRVEYRVEFRFVGQSFERLSGTVSAAAGSSRIRVLTVSPLLVG
jgi:hypothetical protein